MRVFFDTSVLVAASERTHPHHPPALLALQRVANGEDQGFMSAHSMAEVYAALTRLPVQPRIQPAEAQQIVTGNILPHFEIVPLTRQDYEAVVMDMGQRGIPGARIYDALLLKCAARCNAERILTFNVKDFTALAARRSVRKSLHRNALRHRASSKVSARRASLLKRIAA